MSTDGPTQIRLILDAATDERRAAVQQDIQRIYADRSSQGLLRSGDTIKAALRAIEESGEAMLKQTMDMVTPVAKDVEAFAMLYSNLEVHLAFLELELNNVLKLVVGKQNAMVIPVATREATLSFTEIKSRLIRQVEIHRLTFTQPTDLLSVFGQASSSGSKVTEKNKGGKPLAKHWDAMWAAIAAKLYAGDLNPKSQADIEGAMKNWFAGRNQYIGDTMIRERARALWSALQNTD